MPSLRQPNPRESLRTARARGVANAKHIPERTCVGCKRKAPKREMLRIVAGKDGSISPDPGGSLPGRGAYVCYGEACLKAARKRLAKALRCHGEAVAAAWSALELAAGRAMD